MFPPIALSPVTIYGQTIPVIAVFPNGTLRLGTPVGPGFDPNTHTTQDDGFTMSWIATPPPPEGGNVCRQIQCDGPETTESFFYCPGA